ncbi:MAG: hypothetical protein JWM95_570 [Gemmatimonadetes bacterium]|nr:hypothetical protein [Gemmatimonadota bacterium]
MTAGTAPARHGFTLGTRLLPALTFVIATAIALWAAAPYTVGVFHDDGIYVLLAKSIAEGNGFHHSHLVGNPAAIHYPPLYPLLLAAFWRVAPDFPANVSRLLSLNALLLGISALGWYRFAVIQLKWRSGNAALGALAGTLAAPLLTLSGALLSEPFFLALLWPALLLCERTAQFSDVRRVVLAGAFIGVLMLARVHGVALLAALGVVLVMRKRPRDAAILLAAAVIVELPWQLWMRWASPPVAKPLEGAYGSYLGWLLTGVRDGGLPFVVSTVLANASEMWLLLRDQFAAGLPAPVITIVCVIVLVALGGGAAAAFRKAPVIVAFMLAYIGIVKVWPYTPWRFMWAIWPVLVMLTLEGLRFTWNAAGRRRFIVGLAAALPVFAYGRTELSAYATRAWRIPARNATAQITPALNWVRVNTGKDDVILSEGEQVIALYTGRKAAPPNSFTAQEYLVPPDDAASRQRLGEMLAAIPAKYVIVFAPPMIRAAERASLERVATLTNGAVFRVAR